MNQDNKEIADIMRSEIQKLQTDHLVRIDSERKLEVKLNVGRQRIREVINQLVSEGLLVKYEGKGTYIIPVVKNKYVNLICSPSIKMNDPFYNRLLMELTIYSAKHSVNIIPLNMDKLMNGDVDFPILMIGRFEKTEMDNIREIYPRIISFENYPDHDDFVQIYFDHFKIGMNAAKVLASYGHKKVLHIAGPAKYASANYRRTGFIRGTRKYGMESLIIESKMNFRGGFDLAEKVKWHIMQEGYTAVFAANDWMAIGLIQGLKSLGIEVPEQLSVLSVDNIPLADQIAPGLTTYSLDANMMIAECFALMDIAESNYDKNAFRKNIILKPALITRETLRSI